MHRLNMKMYVRVMNMSLAFIYIIKCIYSSIRLEITTKIDNIRIVVQNMKYIYLHSTRLYTVKHTYIYLVQVNFDWQTTWLS